MKILLIDVPFSVNSDGEQVGTFAGVQNILPSLGLGYLAAVAEREGHDVRILDCTRGLGWEDIVASGGAMLPDVVGFTATTPAISNAFYGCRRLRAVAPDAVYVLGGPHATVATDHVISKNLFDFLVLGEGEATFVDLLAHIDGTGSTRPAEIAGLAFSRDGRVVKTDPRPSIEPLDSIPYPARHLMAPPSQYTPTPASYRKLPLAHVFTTRGCPTRCTFCDRGIFGYGYRRRGPENVLGEVEELASRFGVREIRFFDDTFTLDRKRLTRICEGMKQFRPMIPWTCLTRVNAVTPDILHMMHDAGCWQVLFGLESGDDRVMKYLNKGTTVAEGRQAVRWAREAGMRVRGDFLVGIPLETLDTLEKTLAFAKELDIDFAHFNKFIPFPGTDIYRELVAEGYRFDFDLGFLEDHDDLSAYVPPGLTENEYRRFLDRSYREFYLRPTYVLRRLWGMRSCTEFWGHLRGFMTIWNIEKNSERSAKEDVQRSPAATETLSVVEDVS